MLMLEFQETETKETKNVILPLSNISAAIAVVTPVVFAIAESPPGIPYSTRVMSCCSYKTDVNVHSRDHVMCVAKNFPYV